MHIAVLEDKARAPVESRKQELCESISNQWKGLLSIVHAHRTKSLLGGLGYLMTTFGELI